MPGYRILVLGGYGQFGSRIVARLAHDATLHLTVAGRRRDAGERLISKLRADHARAHLEAAALDVDTGDLAGTLAAFRPQLVIHAAGPFQGRDYRVAEAALAAGSHYLDLADGRDFVAGIGALDALAQQHRRWAISGASSVPGLSAAVIEAHLRHFSQLQSVEAAISPGNRTARGLATTQAILGYVGRAYPTLLDGRWRRAHGWQSLRRMSVPGIGRRWLARCEVPDLSVLPARYPQLRHCDFRAGLELRRMHHGLWLASWLVRAGLIRNLAAWAPVLLRLSERWLDRGSDVGVMVMDLAGLGTDQQPLRLRWSLTACAGDGPQIPCTAAVVLARKLAHGDLPGHGARACLDLFSLEEFLQALEGFAVTTALRFDAS